MCSSPARSARARPRSAARWLRQLDSHFSTALIVNPVLSANELMRAIATEFGLEAKGLDRHDTVAAINSFLVRQVQQCGDAVLII